MAKEKRQGESALRQARQKWKSSANVSVEERPAAIGVMNPQDLAAAVSVDQQGRSGIRKIEFAVLAFGSMDRAQAPFDCFLRAGCL